MASLGQIPIYVDGDKVRQANLKGGGLQGNEYTLSGIPTGVQNHWLNNDVYSYDAGFDGTYVYMVARDGAVSRWDKNFQNGAPLFQANAGDMGITYDPDGNGGNGSIWTSNWHLGTGIVAQWTMAGIPLSQFHCPNGSYLAALAYDRADRTLWLWNNHGSGNGRLMQFDTQGNLLQENESLYAVYGGEMGPRRPTGRLVSWGNDGTGQVSKTPTGGDYVAVAAGGDHALTIHDNGSLVSWGYDYYHQVRDTPIGTGFVAVAAGDFHSVAMTSDGRLVSWGYDGYRQVRDTPTGSGFLAVAAGGEHSIAIRANGSLISWGTDAFGLFSDTPTGTGFVAVAAGAYHCVALRSDGRLVSWGYDGYREVRDTPTDAGWIGIAAGYGHSIAIRSDGSLFAWGFDNYGQVSNRPTEIGFLVAAAGGYKSVAIRSNGRLAPWGQDWFGHDTRAPTGKGFFAVAAGDTASVAIQGFVTGALD